MEFVEFCVGSGTLPSRRYSYTVLDKTTKFRSFYIICSFGLGELKMSHRWDNSWWNFFCDFFYFIAKKDFIFFNTFSLSFTSVSSTLFHWKLRFKQTTTLMVHLWEKYACKRCLPAIHPASERMRFMVRVFTRKIK